MEKIIKRIIKPFKTKQAIKSSNHTGKPFFQEHINTDLVPYFLGHDLIHPGLNFTPTTFCSPLLGDMSPTHQNLCRYPSIEHENEDNPKMKTTSKVKTTQEMKTPPKI